MHISPSAIRAATDESQKTRNKKQETKRFSTFAVYRLRHSETKKNIAWFENQVLAEHVRKGQSTIYLKSHGCVHGFQNEVSLINFSTMFFKPIRYPELGHFEMQNRLDTYLFDSQNTVSGTMFIVSRWRRRVSKTVLFRVSHLFSFFWLSSVAALRPCLVSRYGFPKYVQNKISSHDHKVRLIFNENPPAFHLWIDHKIVNYTNILCRLMIYWFE